MDKLHFIYLFILEQEKEKLLFTEDLISSLGVLQNGPQSS